jgi:hypothetical protein
MGSCAELLLPSPSLPLAGMGPKVYFTSVSNNFDAVVVVLSFVEIGIGESCIFFFFFPYTQVSFHKLHKSTGYP